MLAGLNIGTDKGDLGKHLSSLHTILVENISKVPASPETNPCLDQLTTILNCLISNLHHPRYFTI